MREQEKDQGNMGRVANKVAVVTGAASGIGRATAGLLVQEGAAVVLADLDEAAGQEAAEQLTLAGGDTLFVGLDVTSEAGWQRLLDATLARHTRLDILVNNAGVQQTKTVEDATLEDFRLHMGVNMEGIFLGTKHAIATMKENRPSGGSIVNVVSTYGLVGEEMNAPYCASKGAARNFTKSAALHCGKSGYNIRVNAVHPGCCITPMVEQEALDVLAETGSSDRETLLEEWRSEHPIGRLGRPEDIAYGVLYLASDESTFVTGSDLVIDGGYTAQ
jgi:NAD(P)-dependent dehydrogenase (short-subunit alcohol dehydrogenase family)